MRLPQWLLIYIETLCRHNHCSLIAGGGRHPGFALGAGIRQGCPLSPLLFATAFDLLLRRMRRLCPEVLVRAYADDIAAALPSVTHSPPPWSGSAGPAFARPEPESPEPCWACQKEGRSGCIDIVSRIKDSDYRGQTQPGDTGLHSWAGQAN